MKRNKLLKQLSDAYDRLREALAVDLSHELAIDGTIQRFEFCYELVWKTLKAHLEHEGIICASPRECFKEAFRINWINDEGKWLELLQARNRTSHVYDERMAKEIYDIIKTDHAVIGNLIRTLNRDDVTRDT